VIQFRQITPPLLHPSAEYDRPTLAQQEDLMLKLSSDLLTGVIVTVVYAVLDFTFSRGQPPSWYGAVLIGAVTILKTNKLHVAIATYLSELRDLARSMKSEKR
jgi:hypothetical protein